MQPDANGRPNGGADQGGPSVVVTTHYWAPHTGGIETVAAAHATELTRRGWSVRAHSSWTDRTSARSTGDGRFRLTRHRVLNPLERWANVPVPFPLPGLRRRLMADVRSSSIVVAHGHVYPISVAAARAAAAAGRPFVVIQHNPWVEYPRPVEAVERLADHVVGRRVLEAARTVICVSEFTQDYVRSIAPKARTTVIANGVDSNRFVHGDRHGRSDVVRFVAVRRLVPRTGVDLLVEAWRRADLHPHAELLIASDGPMRGALERAAQGLRGIRFLGRVDDDTLVRLLQNADATVVPTRSGEGFGLAAAEAHACGTPVIATNQGALGEVVRDGVDGLLVPTGDAGELARALTRFTHDPTLRAQLRSGAEGTDWSWETVGSRLDALLRDIITG